MPRADRARQVPVVIVGAGPAGLVAAVTLARDGIASLLVERNPGLSPLPRATSVSTRTMELLRSWGLEAEVRAGQLDITAVGAWAAETLASPDGTLLPLGHPDLEQAAAASPTMLAGVPQDHLEPLLLRHLGTFGLTEVCFGTELVALDQDADGVTVELRQRATGQRRTVRAGYLVGAAAQRMTPRGGMGMNTAVAEGHDVGWKLAWVLRGWAGPDLLDSYEAEWRLVGARRTARSAEPGPEASGADALAEDLNGRLPHAWLPRRDGRPLSTLDLLGQGLTLLTGPDPAPWTAAAATLGSAVPLDLHTLDHRTAATLGIDPDGALLARPDAQVITCWPTAPTDPRAELSGAVCVQLVRAPAGQLRSWDRTLAAWPSALTLCQARSTRPSSSRRKVERRTPTEVRP